MDETAVRTLAGTEDRAVTRDNGAKRRSKQKIAVLVLGMHRSGTSLLGGMLDRLGCQGPQHFMPDHPTNPKGFFESPDVMHLNNDIMAALGTRWDDWHGFDPGWQDSPRFAEFRDRIAEVMAGEYGRASLIYLKDPRLCRLLPLWREALVEIGYAPVCLHTHRNPLDVAQSLERRLNISVPPKQGLLLWLRHVLDAEQGSRGLPRMFTSYGQILSDWGAVVERSEAAFGFVWPVLKQAREARMGELIDPSLSHNDSGLDTLMASRAVPQPVKDCLRVLERWASSGEDAAGRDELGRIAAEFDAAAALFGPALTESGAKAKATAARTAELERLSQKLQEAETAQGEELAKLRAAHATLSEERDRLSEEQARLLALDAARQEDLAARAEELASREEELRQANQRLAQLRAEADLIAAELEDRLTSARAEVEAARAAHAEAERRAEAAEAALEELAKAKDKIPAEVEEKLKSYEAELDLLRREQQQILAESVQKAQSYEAELTDLTGVLVERDKRAVQMKREFEAKLRNETDALRRSADQRLAALNKEYQSSTSWRVSAPIRALGRWLRHRRALPAPKG